MDIMSAQNAAVAAAGGSDMRNNLQHSGNSNSRLQHAEMNVPRLSISGGVGVMTLDEQKDKRKKIGLCATCGEVQTHKPGLWKAWMPDVSCFVGTFNCLGNFCKPVKLFLICSFSYF